MDNITKILEQLKTKEKGSRKYNILMNRLHKKLKKTQHFREARYNPKSSEVVDFLKDTTIEQDKKTETILNAIKNSDIKKAINS